MKVAGLDPGRNTAIVVVDEFGRIHFAEQVELDGDMVERSRLLRALLKRSWNTGANGIVVEDISNSHAIGARVGQRRASHSIASVQRDFGLAVGLAVNTWPEDRVMLSLVTQWYPRIGGEMVKKKMCLQLQEQRAVRADPAAVLKNDHLRAAYGLAMYGQGRRWAWAKQ